MAGVVQRGHGPPFHPPTSIQREHMLFQSQRYTPSIMLVFGSRYCGETVIYQGEPSLLGLPLTELKEVGFQ